MTTRVRADAPPATATAHQNPAARSAKTRSAKTGQLAKTGQSTEATKKTRSTRQKARSMKTALPTRAN
jgi:hypothetical protein